MKISPLIFLGIPLACTEELLGKGVAYSCIYCWPVSHAEWHPEEGFWNLTFDEKMPHCAVSANLGFVVLKCVGKFPFSPSTLACQQVVLRQLIDTQE